METNPVITPTIPNHNKRVALKNKITSLINTHFDTETLECIEIKSSYPRSNSNAMLTAILLISPIKTTIAEELVRLNKIEAFITDIKEYAVDEVSIDYYSVQPDTEVEEDIILVNSFLHTYLDFTVFA